MDMQHTPAVADIRQDDPRIDALLAVRCQLGERAAFDELIRRWAEPLRRYALRVVGETGAADELAQEIWLGVLQGMRRLQDPLRFRSWLFGIAHRRLMDHLRGRYAAPDGAVEVAEEIDAGLPDPDRDLEARELERGLQRLPAFEREVLSLFYLEELSLAEVAQVLAIPVGTVKSRLFRARKLLRLEITGENHD
jgi:RNA polymerase sigma-70 factor (ECF subfamily)